MSNKHLHIVTHDVPWPADYGGVVDLFYKLKALHQQGVQIYLHCFTQGRPEQTELNKYCVSVNYYPRKTNISGLSFSLPYIVSSRKSDTLIANLNKDDHPILLEGIHCSYYFMAGKLGKHKVVLRLHNAEFEYYKQLAKNESNLFKKIYYNIESRLLKNYENKIAALLPIVAVSEQDVVIYKNNFSAKDIIQLPVFVPFTLSICKEGNGCFCLYHGNLSINENETAVAWLLQNVFTDTKYHFIIAGKSPSNKLQHLISKYTNCCVVADPSEAEMQDLVCKAQVNVLPSFNSTGVKLKLLNALFNGRHCVVNQAGVAGSGVEEVCHIAADAASFKKIVAQLYEQPFTEQEKEQRQGLLQTLYNNEINAKKLIALLY